VATPTCSNRPIAYRLKTPHSRACNRLADTIARALDAYAAPLREEIEALRADCVIKVANARLAAHEEVPDWVYGVLDDLSDCTPAYISVVLRDKDFDRALAQEERDLLPGGKEPVEIGTISEGATNA
jgi:hypothetical protein